MKDEHLFSTAVLTWAAAKHCCVRAAMTPPTKSKTLLLAGEVTPNVVLQLKCLGIAIILSTMGSTQGRGGLLYILQLTYYSYDVQPQRGEGGGDTHNCVGVSHSTSDQNIQFSIPYFRPNSQNVQTVVSMATLNKNYSESIPSVAYPTMCCLLLCFCSEVADNVHFGLE